MSHPNRNRIKDWPAYLKKFRGKYKLTVRQMADGLQITLKKYEAYEDGSVRPAPYLKKALRCMEQDLINR